MFWRKLLLNGVLDISNVPKIRQFEYVNSTKAIVTNPFGTNPILAHVYNESTGEGAVVCKNKIVNIPVNFTSDNPNLSKLYIRHGMYTDELLYDNFHGYLYYDSNELVRDCTSSFVTENGESISRFNNYFHKKQLDTIEIGEVMKVMGNGQFAYVRVNNFILPEGFREIRIASICNANIGKLYLPSTISKIGDDAFGGSTIGELHIANLDSFSTIYCIDPIGNYKSPLNIYLNNEIVKKVTVPTATTILNAQFGYSTIEEIILPSSIHEIEKNALCGTNIQNITLPINLYYIGDSAFLGCEKLESIEIPDSVTRIGVGAFANCTNLQYATLPKDINYVNNSLFKGCTGLKNFPIVGNSVTHINPSAFAGCVGFEDLDIDLGGVTTIAAYAFSEAKVKSINITNSTTSISDSAFSKCTGKLYIDSTIISKDNNGAFDNALFSEVVIGSTPTSIGVGVFANKSELKNVTIGENVTVIDTDAFNGSPITNLTVLSPHLDKIGHNAFNGSKLETVTFPGVSLLEGCHFTGAIRAIRFLGDVNKIDTSAGANVTDYEGLFYVDMSKSSVVPEVVDSVGFASGIIAVPNSLYEDWIADSKWGEISSRIKGFDNTHHFKVLGAPFITDTSYTWEEFINKGLDLNLFYIKDGYVMNNSTSYVILNGEKVLATDLITEDYYDVS